MKSDNVTKHQEYQRVFSRFDNSQQGKVSVSTIQRCVEAIKSGKRPLLPEDDTAVPNPAEATTTDDKSLHLEEFVSLVEEGDDEDKEKDLKEAFKLYEETTDGITPKSLKRMLSLLGDSKTLKDCELMISQFDINKDGIINFDEFRVMMMQ
ncbi:PREDICTED: probable calcium-binding protein CML40 [Camelina sativa]|uniref:Probable calcium-binding protein CML40 n=1 Tax=Camelina sativa TaxID=90675 RepID=A0ABM0Y6T5_CAMSA|nr:PREDICTED: probable calcium-binding protein CML40 [Camelina sativa]